MKKPTLSALAQAAEIIAALAVVASLVYVGREVRSNTAAIRGTAVQEVSSASQEALISLAVDSALSRIHQIGTQDLSALTDAEAYRFNVLQRQIWLTMQNVFFQNEFGLLEPRVWAAYHRIICGAWANPGARDAWPNHRDALDRHFADLVEGCSKKEAPQKM